MEGRINLNIRESSLRKKRGTSFFDGRDPETFNQLELVPEKADGHADANLDTNRTANSSNIQKDPFRAYQSVKISQVV